MKKRLLIPVIAFAMSVNAAIAGGYFTSGGGGGTPGGSNTQVQYNNSSAFGGVSGVTSNGTLLTFAQNDLVLAGSSTGTTVLTSANSGASNFTITFPALTDTLAVLGSTQSFTGAITFSAKPVTLSGNQSVAAWSTTGTGFVQAATTYQDTSTANSGTVAQSYINRQGVATISASHTSVTYTDAFGFWYEPPVAGTNVTCTRCWAAGFNGAIEIMVGGATPANIFNASPTQGLVVLQAANSAIAAFENTTAGSGVQILTTGSSNLVNALDIKNSGGTNNIFNVGNAGRMSFVTHVSQGTQPTLSGTCTTGSQAGGANAGSFTATCTSQTVIMTFTQSAPNGWWCKANDITTVADTLNQTATAQASCTLTGTTASNDTITFSAVGY